MSTEDRKSQIVEAIKQSDLNKMQELIKDGLNLNELDGFGLTPLHFAVISGFDEGAKLLLENGAQVNSLSNRNTTPLHHAAKGGHTKCLEVLLEHNADVMVRDGSTTPFGYAVKNGHLDVARALMAAAEKQGGVGAKLKLINMTDSKGDTPLMLALAAGNLSFAFELIKAGASIVKDAADSAPASCVLSNIKFVAPEVILPNNYDNNASVPMFVKQIASLREEGSPAADAVKTDFTLKTKNGGEDDMSDGGASISVHKAILAARSPYFASLLKAKPDATEETVESVNGKQLACIVDWIYKNTMPEGSFSDNLAIFGAALHMFDENTNKEGTPLYLLADRLARAFSAATLIEAWKTLWNEADNSHDTVWLLRRHALFFAINKLAGDAQEKDVLELLKTTSPALIGETLSNLEILKQQKEEKPAAAAGAPTPVAPPAPVPASIFSTSRVSLVYSAQCPQEVKDDIVETDKKLGSSVFNQLSHNRLSNARKMVSSIVKNTQSIWFRIPVDETRDGAPSYYTIIKYPMDLQTLRSKYLDRRPLVVDGTISDFLNDGRQIWQNAMIYNRADSPVFIAALKLSKAWEKLIRTMSWGCKMNEASPSPSPSPSPQGMKRPSPSPAPFPSAEPMSPEQLRVMSEKIMEIQNAGDNEALMKLVKIANATPNGGEVELDFAKFSPEVLRRMEAFVNNYIPKK